MREMPGVHIDQNRCSHKSECAAEPEFTADWLILKQQHNVNLWGCVAIPHQVFVKWILKLSFAGNTITVTIHLRAWAVI